MGDRSPGGEPVIKRTVHVNEVKASVERAAYVVDSRAVAEAMLRRVSELRRQRTSLVCSAITRSS